MSSTTADFINWLTAFALASVNFLPMVIAAIAGVVLARRLPAGSRARGRATIGIGFVSASVLGHL